MALKKAPKAVMEQFRLAHRGYWLMKGKDPEEIDDDWLNEKVWVGSGICSTFK